MLSKFAQWLDQRTGFRSAADRLLGEEIPRSIGWRNTLGSVAGALLLVQIATGFLLALYYTPHPDSAYETVEYIQREVTGGALVHALHYWGASFVLAALFLHMVRVFYSGAYKKPREINWIVGLALLAVVIGLAFTGQLLPWNQAGYWAANVGAEIASSAPLIGSRIKQLMLGSDTVGALTLTRFYALHAILLPGILGLLVVLHLYLLRRHGPKAQARDRTSATLPFFPTQAARDMVMISLVLLVLVAVAAMRPETVSLPADSGDTTYVPKPEWYFLAHYELLRFTPGRWRVFATVVLPAGIALLLAALPWIDRVADASAFGRRFVLGGGSLLIASAVGLTTFGIVSRPEPDETFPEPGSYDIVEAGRDVFIKLDCQECHKLDGEGGTKGPDLAGVGSRLKRDYLLAWLKDPQSFVPESQMWPAKVNRRQLNELVAYLQSLRYDVTRDE